MLFGNMVSWKASLQTVVALSTTEVDFMAITEAAKEALWLQGLIGEFGVKQVTVSISSDSQSAIHLTKNQGYHEKSKHIDVRLHFIRDLVYEKRIKVKKIHTDGTLQTT